MLIQKKDELNAAIAEIRPSSRRSAARPDDAKAGLVAFQGEIEKLKREKHEMLAKKANAEARIADPRDPRWTEHRRRHSALENVRSNRQAAGRGRGRRDRRLELDAKLDEIKEKTATASARSQLDEMKKQMAAQKAAKEGKVEKTMCSAPRGAGRCSHERHLQPGNSVVVRTRLIASDAWLLAWY